MLFLRKLKLDETYYIFPTQQDITMYEGCWIV